MSLVLNAWCKSQNEEYLWNEWVKTTQHQYRALKKTQDEPYFDVAVATILAPVSFSFEPNNTVCGTFC